jgi:hypothetical protein
MPKDLKAESSALPTLAVAAAQCAHAYRTLRNARVAIEQKLDVLFAEERLLFEWAKKLGGLDAPASPLASPAVASSVTFQRRSGGKALVEIATQKGSGTIVLPRRQAELLEALLTAGMAADGLAGWRDYDSLGAALKIARPHLHQLVYLLRCALDNAHLDGAIVNTGPLGVRFAVAPRNVIFEGEWRQAAAAPPSA